MGALPTVPDWVELEHRVAEILTQQEFYGWYFDEPAARELALSLGRELRNLEAVLRNRHPFVAGSTFNPKRPNKTQGYYPGAESVRLKEHNPTSRDHIAWIFATFYDWKPETLTTTGKPVIDETVLKDIGSDIALQYLRCLELRKQLGMLEEGKNAWLQLVRKDRIHHHCSVATNTHRCAHRNPNLAQVPATEEFRKLFRASPGRVMVGADLSGIELRMLAHYLARYDGGKYADILLNGDIHQSNADKIGISRRDVKTVTYAFLYGAGDRKIGLSIDKSLDDKQATKLGRDVRASYVAAIDGLSSLLDAVKSAAGRGFIRSIDGRKIKVDGAHKALNYLLQSSAGVIAKRWMVLADEKFTINADINQLAFVHDEIQYECPEPLSKGVARSLEGLATAAGEYYQLRVPIAAEARIGATWADTH